VRDRTRLGQCAADSRGTSQLRCVEVHSLAENIATILRGVRVVDMGCGYCAEVTWTENPVCTCVEACARSICPCLLDNFEWSAIPVPRFRADR
jgi:hypothetical protein